MGFSTLLDVMGSIMIGGFLLLILLRLNSSATENSFNYSEELVLQQNLTSVAKIIEYDFRKIGYCEDPDLVASQNESITFADSISIKFKTDVNKDSVLDIMHYRLGALDMSTDNPDDKFLYRIVNGTDTTNFRMGITDFKLIYMDTEGDTLKSPVTDPGQIASMEINLSVEKTASYGVGLKQNEHAKYSGAFWRQIKLVARNLENR